MPNVPRHSTKSLMIMEQREKLPNQGRKEVDWKFYNSKAWRKLAKMVEEEEIFCRECLKNGITTDATGRKGATDHIRPVNKGGAKLDRRNLQRLCQSCHAKKSAKDK